MMTEDHLFTLEVDIIQFDDKSDRVIVNGFLGENIETQYHEGKLHIKGDEASIILNFSEEELKELLKDLKQ